jgi:3-methylfumaryl-CoA hydratase
VKSDDGDGARTRFDTMAPENAERLAAVLDTPQVFRPGDELPLLWHWAYFSDIVAQSDLGHDGHPARTDGMTERFPRRMAAAGSVHRLGTLLIGMTAERRSCLVDLTEKQGRTGPLLFATWRHVVEQDGRGVLEEQQTLVYRSAPAGRAPSGGPEKQDKKAAGQGVAPQVLRRSLAFDSAQLFRFSAVTWNAHRIHYDQTYATATEGYRGLVVQAPLLATHLALDASRELGRLSHVEFRAFAPVFADERVEIFGGTTVPGEFSAVARRGDGTIAMSLVADAGI